MTTFVNIKFHSLAISNGSQNLKLGQVILFTLTFLGHLSSIT